MKRIIALLFALGIVVGVASAQSAPPPYVVYDSSGNPYPNGSGTPLGFTPPPFTCYTIVSGSVVPCDFSGGGGGGATLPFPGVVWATSANGGTVATGTQINSVLQSLANCGTTGYVLSPASGTCIQVTTTPPIEYPDYTLAVCDGGVGFDGSWTTYNANRPPSSCVNQASSGQGYMSFAAGVSSPNQQYAELKLVLPPYWTSLSMYLNFYSPSTSGNSVMDVQTACVTADQVVGSPTYSSPVITTTTAVSGTANGAVQTALIPNIATPGANGCPSSPTTPTTVLVRMYADSTSAVITNGLDTPFVIQRSQ